MLDIKFIRENTKKVQNGAKAKGVDVDLDKLLKLDTERVKLIEERDVLRGEKKTAAKPTATEIAKIKKSKAKLAKVEEKLENVESEWRKIMLSIPNMPKDDVKVAKNESENEVIKTVGKPTKFNFEPKDHQELVNGLIDNERAAKVSGSRFTYLKGKIAQLELALINYAFDVILKEGFEAILPPVLITDESMEAMGYLEHGGEEEIYKLKNDDLFLVGTSEQSIGPMHKNETLEEHTLPLRYAAFSPCFRREAGSYGKDVKGIFRLHQFNKVEMFSITMPEESDKEHEFLLAIEERIMKGLEIPYQVVKMVSGDLGLPAARKYDLEAWSPVQNKYRETHSTSTTTDFQSRRLNIKFRRPDGTKEHVHMLNGTGIAMERMIIMILENYQQKDGSVKVPEVLQKYTGFKEIK